MRKQLYNYIQENEDVILLHCDMFPYKHERIIDLGSAEFLITQYAYGLELQGYRVLIYSVAQFVVDKSVYFLNNYPLKNTKFVTGGAAWTYYPSSVGHYLFNDFQVMGMFTDKLYAPITNRELQNLLDKKEFSYIRLYPENLQFKGTPFIDNPIPIYSYGWLYVFLKTRYKNVCRMGINEKVDGLVVEDHINRGINDKWIGIEEKKEYSLQQFLAYIVRQIGEFIGIDSHT